MTLRDPARWLLVERGAAEHVVKGGLEGLVTSWEKTALESQKGYAHGLDEWRNEVDARNLIDAAMKVALPAQKKAMKARLDAADARFWKACEPLDGCVWGPEAAKRESWTATTHWWYFLAPKKAGDALAGELASLSKKPGSKR